jgi:hypothetical protein
MANIPLHEPDGDLVPLLRSASQDDLGILVQYIMKAATSELELYPDFKLENPSANDDPPVFGGNHALYVDDISAEIQKFGGNTIVNIFRGGQGVPYAEVARDVADKSNQLLCVPAEGFEGHFDNYFLIQHAEGP